MSYTVVVSSWVVSVSFFFFKQKTAYEMRISDWSSDVCSSDLAALGNERLEGFEAGIDLEPAAGVKFTLTLFDNRVENAIANVTLAPNLRQRQNLPAIKATGAEASLSASLGAFRLTGSMA